MLRYVSTFYRVASEHGLKIALHRSQSKAQKLLKKLGLSSRDGNTESLTLLAEQDGNLIHPKYPQWKYAIPLPPPSLMFSIGAPNIENFFVVADTWAQVIRRFMPAESQVLDIGCGCGRTARILTHNSQIKRYIGFDVIAENIQWCKKYITPATQGKFEFHHFDIYSAEYNPQGKIQATELRFPAENGSVQLCFAASLFTHILEPDTRHYLSEISRTLDPKSGIAILSIHIHPETGKKYSGQEGKVDILPEYFEEMLADSGLKVEERIGDICGQEAYAIRRQ